MFEVEFYSHPGREQTEVDEYLDSMLIRHRDRALAIMKRLEMEGHALKRPHSDMLRAGIRELRCGFGRLEHRFLYFFDRKKIVITHGFLKKTSAVPEREIAKAERARTIYLRDLSTEEDI